MAKRYSIKKPWKKNIRKISPQIQTKINGFDTDTCLASCIIQIDFEVMRTGAFRHLGIHWGEDGVQYPEEIIPPVNIGIYSRQNQEGYEVVYKDRPKTSKSWYITVPNYGDWEKGDHDIVFSRDVYQRDFIPPKLVSIKIDLVGEDVRKQAYTFRFTVNEVLNRQSANCHEQLLFNLNLLQENTGNHDVYPSKATLEDYLQTLYVNWEILPPGERDETITRIIGSNNKNDSPMVRNRIADRYDFLLRLKPKSLIKGSNEFRRYFGAQFADDLVVFENVDYGNAIYIMFGNWEELSKKSRTELLSSKEHTYERIIHTKTWKKRLRRIIMEEKLKRGIKH